MIISPQIEHVLQDVIFTDLEKGRKNYDLPHTKAVVHWTKELLKKIVLPNVDSQVVITAAYAHDWGYIGLFDGVNSDDLETIKKKKDEHMVRGAEMITDLIHSRLADFFSPKQIERTAHLVWIHDRIDMIKTDDEAILMEADTMGALDTSFVTPTFSKEDNSSYIEREVKGRRFPLFKHEQALEIGQKLLQKREAFYA